MVNFSLKEGEVVLLARLHLEDGELDNLIWEEELDKPGEKP